MKRAVFAAAAVAGMAGSAVAGEVTQTIDINITPDNSDGQQQFSLVGFDTMGGTRVLEAVRLQIITEMSVDFAALNYGDFDIQAGDWQVLPGFNMFFYAEPQGAGGEGDSTFNGIGSLGWDGVTGFLPAGSGDPIFGEPGRYEFSRSGALDSTFIEDTPSQLEFYTTYANLDASIAPFAAPEIFAPPGSFLGLEAAITQTGTLTVTYEYSMIPAPGAAATLGLAGLAGLRRRR